MSNKIKMITFDLDDTLWDNKPTITNAEVKTREWIEDRVGAIEWGDLNDFLQIREALIKKDKSISLFSMPISDKAPAKPKPCNKPNPKAKFQGVNSYFFEFFLKRFRGLSRGFRTKHNISILNE